MKSLVFTLLIFSILTLSAQNNVVEFYTIDYNKQMLCKIDTKGDMKNIVRIKSNLVKYFGMDYNKKDGKLYIILGNSFYEVNVKTGELIFKCYTYFTDGTSNGGSRALSIDDNGNTYIYKEVSAGGVGKLYRLDDYSKGEMIHLSNSGSGIVSCLGLEFDNSGKLWNADECCFGALNYFNIDNGVRAGSVPLKYRFGFPTDLDFQNNEMYLLDIKNETNSNKTDLCKVV